MKELTRHLRKKWRKQTPRKLVKLFKRGEAIPFEVIEDLKKPTKMLKRLSKLGGHYLPHMDAIGRKTHG